MTWHFLKDNPPEPGKRVLFGCENGFVCEGFMCYFSEELRPVRFDGDRLLFGNIVPLPKWWGELPRVPEGVIAHDERSTL